MIAPRPYALLSSALLLFALSLPAAAVSAKSIALSFDGGRVSDLVNGLTGEDMVQAPTSPSGAGLRLLGGSLAFAQPSARTASSTHESYTWLGGSGETQATAEVHFAPDTKSGGMAVTQRGQTWKPGLCGVSWEIGDIPDSFTVLVPGESGQRIGSDSPFGIRTFEYPMTWEAPFVLVQGRKGGFIVRAEDTTFRFKVLTVEHAAGVFRLRFETRNDAPFEDKSLVTSVRWIVSAYKGSWQNGASIYRNWSTKSYGLLPLKSKRPVWAKDIRFVVTMGMEIPTLRSLAQRTDPKQTLLYIPNWRRDGYDRNYPDYTALPEFAPFVKEAHKLGFRVMAHVNYFGVDLKHPAYEKLKRYQLRDAFTSDLQWWWPEALDPTIKFAYINPASKEWRRLFVDKMKELVRTYHVDALHTDQTLVMMNDRNGLIDGMNCIQGNLALHKDLYTALPDVAISGEGLDEVTCKYECFAQRHESGINLMDGSWSDARIAQAHPISSYVLLPRTTMYGYLGMPNPQDAPDRYAAWRTAYERYGVIPTLMWPSAEQLKSMPSAVATVLDEARFAQKYKPVPDFDGVWNPNDLFVYRLSDGARAAYVSDGGSAFQVTRAGRVQTLFRRIRGVTSTAVGGSIPGWLAYDGQSILALNPASSYTWSAAPRDLGATHIESLPAEGAVVAQYGVHPEFARFRIESSMSDIHLWDYTGPTSTGVALTGAVERRQPGLSLADPSGGTVQPTSDGLDVHPPWSPDAGASPDPMKTKGLGVAFAEYEFTVPAEGQAWFDCGVSLRSGAVGKSDGVLIRAIAKSGEQRAAAQVVGDTTSPAPLRLGLDAFAGKSVTLRLEIDPGPAGSPTFDWGRISRPMLHIRTSQQAEIGLKSTVPVDRVLSSSGSATIREVAKGSYRVSASLPCTLTFPFGKPATGETFDLLTVPYSTYALTRYGEESSLFGFAGASVGDAICMGEKRVGLNQHPPSSGSTLVDYYLSLPSTPLRFVTAIGLRDGSKSTGVAFDVLVNGERVFHYILRGEGAWTPVSVDLSRWAGAPVMLTLVTDSLGDNSFDWAVWAEPRLIP